MTGRAVTVVSICAQCRLRRSRPASNCLLEYVFTTLSAYLVITIADTLVLALSTYPKVLDASFSDRA